MRKPEGGSGVGHLAIVINIAATRSLAAFEADMEALIDDLKQTPRQPMIDQIHYPGELEAISDARLRQSGIELPRDTADTLRTRAADLGIKAPF